LTTSVLAYVPVAVVEKAPPEEFEESVTERPPLGAAAVRLSRIAVEACPAVSVCAVVANVSGAFTITDDVAWTPDWAAVRVPAPGVVPAVNVVVAPFVGENVPLWVDVDHVGANPEATGFVNWSTAVAVRDWV
jgi:hypothetical protein